MTILIKILCIFMYFAFSELNAAVVDSLSVAFKPRNNKTLSAYIGSKVDLGNSDFYREYTRAFSPNTSFPVQTVLGVAIKTEAIPTFRFGLNGEYFAADFVDTHSGPVVSPVDSLPVGSRFISEKIRFTAIPLLLTADYIPFSTQFRTYFGGGLGLTIGHVLWEESTISTFANDRRIGGTHIDKNILAPTACIYTGLELGFDKRFTNKNVTSLYIEARYSIIAMSAPMLASVASQFFNPPEAWQHNYSVGASGFSLSIGLAFQTPDL